MRSARERHRLGRSLPASHQRRSTGSGNGFAASLFRRTAPISIRHRRRPCLDAHQRLEQLRPLSHAPLGDSTDIRYRNADSATEQIARISAVDDALKTMDLFNFAPPPSAADETAIISSQSRDGYGYIRLTALAHLDDITKSPEDIWIKFQTAVEDFKAAGLSAIVLNIRGNHGGYDSLATAAWGMYAFPGHNNRH